MSKARVQNEVVGHIHEDMTGFEHLKNTGFALWKILKAHWQRRTARQSVRDMVVARMVLVQGDGKGLY